MRPKAHDFSGQDDRASGSERETCCRKVAHRFKSSGQGLERAQRRQGPRAVPAGLLPLRQLSRLSHGTAFFNHGEKRTPAAEAVPFQETGFSRSFENPALYVKDQSKEMAKEDAKSHSPDSEAATIAHARRGEPSSPD
jgi:hypothetical protein